MIEKIKLVLTIVNEVVSILTMMLVKRGNVIIMITNNCNNNRIDLILSVDAINGLNNWRKGSYFLKTNKRGVLFNKGVGKSYKTSPFCIS